MPSVPIIPPAIIPRHPPDDLVIRLEMLRDEADAAGEGTLAYLLECALIEARAISERKRRDAENAAAGPRDLWRPV